MEVAPEAGAEHSPQGQQRDRSREPAETVEACVPADGRLEATDTSAFFGFKDDVVVRVRASDAGSRIDVRSKSRVGLGDVGANARRVRAFLKLMDGG